MDKTRDDVGGTIHCSGRAELAVTWFISLFLVGFIWVLWFAFGTQPPALPRRGDAGSDQGNPRISLT